MRILHLWTHFNDTITNGFKSIFEDTNETFVSYRHTAKSITAGLIKDGKIDFIISSVNEVLSDIPVDVINGLDVPVLLLGNLYNTEHLSKMSRDNIENLNKCVLWSPSRKTDIVQYIDNFNCANIIDYKYYDTDLEYKISFAQSHWNCSGHMAKYAYPLLLEFSDSHWVSGNHNFAQLGFGWKPELDKEKVSRVISSSSVSPIVDNNDVLSEAYFNAAICGGIVVTNNSSALSLGSPFDQWIGKCPHSFSYLCRKAIDLSLDERKDIIKQQIKIVSERYTYHDVLCKVYEKFGIGTEKIIKNKEKHLKRINKCMK
ncbi:MAG: hypothetical protein WC967_12630 [Balneolaceae bacterium]